MALFPRIVSPCPYGGPLSDIIEGDACRLCKRPVSDLTDMDDAERAVFLAGCSGQTCVTYLAPRRAVFASAAALATMALPLAITVQSEATKAVPTAAPKGEPAMALLSSGAANDPAFERLTGDVAMPPPDPLPLPPPHGLMHRKR